MADTVESTGFILRHPFLHQAHAHFDYSCREKTLFYEKVPQFYPSHQTKVHIVRVAHPAHHSHADDEDIIFIFIKKYDVLVACSVMQTQQSPKSPCCSLERGAVTQVLQPTKVLEKVEIQYPRTLAVPEPINPVSVSRSCTLRAALAYARLIAIGWSTCYSPIMTFFSAGSTNLSCTSLVQNFVQTNPGPPLKQLLDTRYFISWAKRRVNTFVWLPETWLQMKDNIAVLCLKLATV